MSVTDVIGSVSLILHPFLLPRYTREYGFDWASGNQASCSAMGFFFVLCPTLVSFLSMLLSLYFYLKVKRNTQDKHLIKTFQILVAASVTLCLGIAVAGLAIPQGYAPRVYHNVCNFGDCVVGKLDKCEYETGASWYLGWVQAVFIALPALIALVLTFMLYCAVRTKLYQSRRFAFTGQNTQRQNDMMMAVRNQAFLYSLAYWNSFFWYLFFGVIGGESSTTQ